VNIRTFLTVRLSREEALALIAWHEETGEIIGSPYEWIQRERKLGKTILGENTGSFLAAFNSCADGTQPGPHET